jgi:AcrR family transcriptional regulator
MGKTLSRVNYYLRCIETPLSVILISSIQSNCRVVFVAQSTPKKKERSTLSAGDWEQQALVLIAEKGIRAVAIESLARRMGVTKGSFYWHFPNRDALLEQSLLRWEKHDEANLQASLGAIADPRERLRSFFRRTGREQLTHDVYSSLLTAADHPKVEPLLERVAERRMKRIEAAFCEIGFTPEEASHRARLTYSTYLGFLQLQRQHQAPRLSSEEFEAYMIHLIATLVPEK